MGGGKIGKGKSVEKDQFFKTSLVAYSLDRYFRSLHHRTLIVEVI
jgi:hypothetical protein